MTEIKLIRDDDKATKILAAVAQIDAGAELAPVVRCKDCRHYGSGIEPSHGATVRYCKIHKGLVLITKDTFCNYGERRINDGE